MEPIIIVFIKLQGAKGAKTKTAVVKPVKIAKKDEEIKVIVYKMANGSGIFTIHFVVKIGLAKKGLGLFLLGYHRQLLTVKAMFSRILSK